MAVNLRRQDLTTEFVGRVGDDEDGRRILAALRACSIDVAQVDITPVPTCLGLLETNGSGLTRLEGTAGDCSHFVVSADRIAQLINRRHVHMKEVVDVDLLATELGGHGCSHSYDYSDSLDQLYGRAADISFFSCGTGASGLRRAREALQAALTLGATVAVATLGADGSIGRCGKNDEIRVPAVRTEQLDSIGAGDSFIAAVIAGMLRGEDLARSLKRGAAAGAATCRHAAAWPQPLLPYAGAIG